MKQVKYTDIPDATKEHGSKLGKFALAIAIGEYHAGAREIGGNNMGPYVKLYLNGLAPDGSSWCAAFATWCFNQAYTKLGVTPPSRYNVSARSLFNDLRGLEYMLEPGEQPQSGDLVFWWRMNPTSWMGHVGIVIGSSDTKVWTIEGNRTSKVECFQYDREGDAEMDKLLGYCRIPDSLLEKKVDGLLIV